MTGKVVVRVKLQFARGSHGQKYVRSGKAKSGAKVDTVPRIAKLMALAIHFDELIRQGKVKDYAELARLGQVSRARMTQIMGLANLAPDISELLLWSKGTITPSLKQLDDVQCHAEWTCQLTAFEAKTSAS